MHEYQLSQFRPGDSQRSRNVPDVLFVDEDGNPIEAGEENLIFVDETGIEMTEDKAINLIDSGKFVDSRILYDDELGPFNRSNTASFHGSNKSLSNLLMNNPFSKSNSLTHAQIQAVQAAQIAQTQALLNAAPTPSDMNDSEGGGSVRDNGNNYNTLTSQKLTDLFSQATAKAREQQDEIDQIEADATSNYSYQTTLVSELQRNKSSDRRLPNRPEKKAITRHSRRDLRTGQDH